MPEVLKYIDDYAFESCKALSDITIPSTVIEINSLAFGGCYLNTITFPEGLKTIGAYALSHNKIESITIPGNVETIGNNAFSNNVNLKHIYLYPNNNDIKFYDTNLFVISLLNHSKNAIYENATLHILKETSIDDWFGTDFYRFKNVVADLDPQN